MTQKWEIQEYVRDLVEKYQPERVVLFGSHARGEAGLDSDVDLLVIMPFEGKPVDQALHIRRHVKKHFPLDLIVQTPETTKERARAGDPLLKEALSQGQTLYDRSLHGMGS